MQHSEAKRCRKIIKIKKLVVAKLDEAPILRYVLPWFKKTFRFLELPGEIRKKIYNEVISDASLNGVHSLRLANHQIKHELDYELVQASIAQVNEAISGNLKNPMGYVSPIDTSLPRHQFWSPTHPMLIMDPVPKTYTDIQNLHLTTYVSDIHSPSAQHNEELEFFYALPASVRSVTITLLVPPHIHDSRIALSGINALALCLTHTVTWIALTTPRHEPKLGARVGIARLEVRFPMRLECTAAWYWKCLARLGKRSGMDMWQVKNQMGMVTGMAFRLGGVQNMTRRESLVWRLEEVWEKMKERARE